MTSGRRQEVVGVLRAIGAASKWPDGLPLGAAEKACREAADALEADATLRADLTAAQLALNGERAVTARLETKVLEARADLAKAKYRIAEMERALRMIDSGLQDAGSDPFVAGEQTVRDVVAEVLP